MELLLLAGGFSPPWRSLSRGAALRHASPHAGLLSNLFPPPPPNPADFYSPDLSAPLPGLPRSYEDVHAGAIDGVLRALQSGLSTCEVDFPPVSSVNARGDGSAKSEQLVAEANVAFARILRDAIGEATIVGCSAESVRALGSDALPSKQEGLQVEEQRVAICIAPCTEEQWERALSLKAKAIVIVNGLLQNGLLEHAYYFKPMTAFSQMTGGVVRTFPGPYVCYNNKGELMQLEVQLARQGKRALPDTKSAQMLLQNSMGQSLT
ncbi:MAG: hypothetical protein SGPRY_009175 [Prymnesium sp.]